jgi:Tol biopolymer transport system component
VSDANGKVLVSETDENGKTRLSLTNLKGGPVVLAEDAVSASGWLSPDGTHVAYWIGDNRNNGTVTLADMNGTAIATLAKDARLENVVWSEDSSKLFISAVENDEIHTMMYDANGQNKQELARRGRLSEAAFVGGYAIYQIADNSGKWSLYVQQPGGDKRDLVRGADDLRWSVMPDQRSLVIYSKRQGRTSFRIEPVGGGDPIEIERGVDDAFWMVDSGRLIYVVENANSSSVESVTFDGKDKQEIGRGIDRLTSFDSRGGRVLLGVKENGEASVQYWDGKTLRKLAEGADAYSQVTFTPDGRAALYTDVYGDGPGNSSVYKVGLDGKQSDQLIEGAQIVHHGWY